MQNLSKTIGRHVRRLRKQRGWTQTRLAEQLNMSLDMVGRMERGQASPSLATLSHLAQVLETQPEFLLLDDFIPPTTSSERERCYARLHDLLAAVDDDELDWVVSIVDAVVRKRRTPTGIRKKTASMSKPEPVRQSKEKTSQSAATRRKGNSGINQN